jgi:cytochrome b561/polyisoprenoid-binding protein YceI
MPLTNTHQRYGGIAKGFHWLMALMILTLIGLGLWAEDLPTGTEAELARKAWAFSVHKTLGVAAFFVALGRILWALAQPRPGLLNADRRLENFLAEAVHWLLYGAIVIVPLAGWISHAAAEGFAPIRWPLGQGLPLVPKSPAVEHLFATIHVVAGKVLIGAILLHAAGALKHHVIDRDATLRRMLPGTAAIGPLPAQHGHRAPALAAAGLWIATLALAVILAAPAQEGDAAAPPALAEVTSQWQVEEGEIAITVAQFGSEVTGRFADWTTGIAFDGDSVSGEAGSVTATVSIASLTLGSVTQQALGADFFDAGSFPTATFTGPITHAADGYEVNGTLTIKDQSLPVTLPFILSLTGDRAEMRGDVTLDRRDFGIGDNIADEATLGNTVAVKITLTAQRAE